MKTTFILPVIAAFASLLPLVNAHGFVTKLTIDGKVYKGNTPASSKVFDSPIRQISSINPVKGATNKNLACGQSAKNAALVADAKPGSTITFNWGDPDGSKWPHNTGPLMTYMASCGSTTCDKFDASKAKWFKIAEAGKKSGSSDWVQQDIMNGKSYSTKIPADLKSGQYLIRHEIIALHLAQTEGGAEFYPSCSQVNVQGDGTESPPTSDLVSFPGAYKDTDPGIFDKNVYGNSAYKFPGPAIVSLIAGGDSGNSGDDDDNSSSSVPSSTSTHSSSVPSSTSGPKGGNNTNTSGNGSCSSKSKRAVTPKRALRKRNVVDFEHVEINSVIRNKRKIVDLLPEEPVNDTAVLINDKPQELSEPSVDRPKHVSRVMARLASEW